MDKKIVKKEGNAWKIGEQYFIRTVTMALTGRLEAIDEHELVLSQAAWIANTGRFADFLLSGVADEVEPFPPGEVIVGRGSIVDACIFNRKLPDTQK